MISGYESPIWMVFFLYVIAGEWMRILALRLLSLLPLSDLTANPSDPDQSDQPSHEDPLRPATPARQKIMSQRLK